MRPLDTAKALYDRAGLSIERDLGMYLRGGYVFSGPDFLLLGRPILREDPDKWVSGENADAWYVRFAAGEGSLRKIAECMPFKLPFLAWRRGLKSGDERLHVISTERFLKKV